MSPTKLLTSFKPEILQCNIKVKYHPFAFLRTVVFKQVFVCVCLQAAATYLCACNVYVSVFHLSARFMVGAENYAQTLLCNDKWTIDRISETCGNSTSVQRSSPHTDMVDVYRCTASGLMSSFWVVLVVVVPYPPGIWNDRVTYSVWPLSPHVYKARLSEDLKTLLFVLPGLLGTYFDAVIAGPDWPTHQRTDLIGTHAQCKGWVHMFTSEHPKARMKMSPIFLA